MRGLGRDAHAFGPKQVRRSFTVECDEVYVVAGHKGHPEAVKKKGGPPDGGG
jgi:hypothetical protein